MCRKGTGYKRKQQRCGILELVFYDTVLYSLRYSHLQRRNEIFFWYNALIGKRSYYYILLKPDE